MDFGLSWEENFDKISFYWIVLKYFAINMWSSWSGQCQGWEQVTVFWHMVTQLHQSNAIFYHYTPCHGVITLTSSYCYIINISVDRLVIKWSGGQVIRWSDVYANVHCHQSHWLSSHLTVSMVIWQCQSHVKTILMKSTILC